MGQWNAVAQPGPDSFHHIPIQEISIPLIFNRHIIAIYAESATALGSWYTAGLLKQYVRSGLTVGGVTDSINHTQRIFLKQIQIIYFRKIINLDTHNEIDFTLGFVVPRWLKDISISIWQYTGLEQDTTENAIAEVDFYLHQKL
jgi:hypothetical protein